MEDKKMLPVVAAAAKVAAECMYDCPWIISFESGHRLLGHDGPAVFVLSDCFEGLFAEYRVTQVHRRAYRHVVLDGVLFYSIIPETEGD